MIGSVVVWFVAILLAERTQDLSSHRARNKIYLTCLLEKTFPYPLYICSFLELKFSFFFSTPNFIFFVSTFFKLLNDESFFLKKFYIEVV